MSYIPALISEKIWKEDENFVWTNSLPSRKVTEQDKKCTCSVKEQTADFLLYTLPKPPIRSTQENQYPWQQTTGIVPLLFTTIIHTK